MHISLARKESLLIRIQILVADHGSQIAARFLKAGKFWEKFQKFNFRKSLITDHGSQNYMHMSHARKSLLIRIQILVSDHGSQIAARFLKAGKFWEKFKKFNFRKSLITDHGSQNYMHISLARKSHLIRIQRLVADHGSQIAARILKAGKCWENLSKMQS